MSKYDVAIDSEGRLILENNSIVFMDTSVFALRNYIKNNAIELLQKNDDEINRLITLKCAVLEVDLKSIDISINRETKEISIEIKKQSD